ncbi:MAG: hypothetical protein RSL74_10265 [Clostridium sp.]
MERANIEKEHMGLTTWADAPTGKIKKTRKYPNSCGRNPNKFLILYIFFPKWQGVVLL